MALGLATLTSCVPLTRDESARPPAAEIIDIAGRDSTAAEIAESEATEADITVAETESDTATATDTPVAATPPAAIDTDATIDL